MDYRIFRMSTGEEESSTEAHVFARAYRAVWRATHRSEPAGWHQVAALELVLDFGEPAVARIGASHVCAASVARRAETIAAGVDVPPPRSR